MNTRKTEAGRTGWVSAGCGVAALALTLIVPFNVIFAGCALILGIFALLVGHQRWAAGVGVLLGVAVIAPVLVQAWQQ